MKYSIIKLTCLINLLWGTLLECTKPWIWLLPYRHAKVHWILSFISPIYNQISTYSWHFCVRLFYETDALSCTNYCKFEAALMYRCREPCFLFLCLEMPCLSHLILTASVYKLKNHGIMYASKATIGIYSERAVSAFVVLRKETNVLTMSDTHSFLFI